jgi:hypothetical protein
MFANKAQVSQHLLDHGRELFLAGQNVMVVYYEIGERVLVQLMRSFTSTTDFGLTITLFSRDERGEVSPEFVVNLDTAFMEVLIDPFGFTVDELGFDAELALSRNFLERLLARLDTRGLLVNGQGSLPKKQKQINAA